MYAFLMISSDEFFLFQVAENATDLFHPKRCFRSCSQKSHINILMDTWHEWKKSQPMWCHDVFNEREKEERESEKMKISAASKDVEKCNKFKYTKI